MNEPTVISTDWSPVEWAARITASWRESVNSIFEVGRLLQQAKKNLEVTTWRELCDLLPFGENTAYRLIAIASDDKLFAHMQILPPHWGTIYELTKLSDDAFEAAVEEGVINSEMQHKDISTKVKQSKRAEKERKLGGVQLALPDAKFGVILADPAWRFEPYSRETGMDRAADNHYPTCDIEEIRALDLISIAADDCVLFLWATVPMLPHALQVMKDWGFAYKSHFAWIKDTIGTGYWNRNAHELLLVGTRGNIPAPAAGMQVSSVQEAPRGKHSAKPELFLEMIEEYFPTLPKIELNRRGPARPGWAAWGNETTKAGADVAARFTASAEPARASPVPPAPTARAGSPFSESIE
jgi:N6-adenosine-specific RNA methylase IME4